MAEHGAHLTTTEQSLPSIFEVVASDSLGSTFYLAIKKLCSVNDHVQLNTYYWSFHSQVLASSNPVKFGWTITHYDELYLALNAAIQQFYVRAYGTCPLFTIAPLTIPIFAGGSLAEVFYGLTRSRWNSDTLSAKSRFVIFSSIVLVPYLRQKLDHLIAAYTNDIENNADPPQRRRAKQITVRCFTAAIAAYDALQVFQYIAYMAGASKSHSLQMRALHMQLVYLPNDEQDEWTWTDLLNGKLK